MGVQVGHASEKDAALDESSMLCLCMVIFRFFFSSFVFVFFFGGGGAHALLRCDAADAATAA